MRRNRVGFTARKARERRFGGGTPYTASAVHFDGAATLVNDGLVASDADVVSVSLWFKIEIGAGNAELFAVAIVGTGPALYVLVQPDGFLEFYASDGTNYVDAFVNAAAFTIGAWHSFRGTINTTTGTAVAFIDNAALVFDDVDADGTPFVTPLNGNSFGVPSRVAPTQVCDLADLWVSAGAAPSFSATGDDFITADGKPKDPGGFPSGIALLSGNASTFGTNQGTGGAFTLTGSLTNASSSPSD